MDRRATRTTTTRNGASPSAATGFHGPHVNGLVALAAAAGATRRIRLLSAITLVPLYPAALLAKQIATLDLVSGGRFELGVGVGGEFAKEFEACGVPVKERARAPTKLSRS